MQNFDTFYISWSVKFNRVFTQRQNAFTSVFTDAVFRCLCANFVRKQFEACDAPLLQPHGDCDKFFGVSTESLTNELVRRYYWRCNTGRYARQGVTTAI